MSEKVLVDRELLNDLVSSLEGEVESRYSNETKDHPAMRRDYECDIEPVIRGKELLAAAPAAPEADLSSHPLVAALCDLSYRAGLKAGWNYCADGDETGFARSMESAREAVAVLNERRQGGAPAAPVAQEPVATVVERKEGSRTWFDGVIHATAIVMGQIKDGDPLYATPPAPDAVLVEALRNLLPDDDIRHLRRFQEICEDTDADGHDLPKEAVRRLERAGALRSCGFGRHETTLFGDAILAALAGKGATK